MWATPLRRVHLGIAPLVTLALVGTVLANTTDAPPVSALPYLEPEFLAWGGEPYRDGLNHYLVTISATESAGNDDCCSSRRIRWLPPAIHHLR